MEQKLKDSNKKVLCDADKTAMTEYLAMVKSEYENERNKKQSFENRVGIILTLLGAICVFIFQQVRLRDIIMMMVAPITFILIVKILAGLAAYICFTYTMIKLIRTITVKDYDNFEVKDINESLLSEQRTIGLCRIIFTYRDIVMQHRNLNTRKARTFNQSLYGICFTILALIIYVSV